MKKCNKSPNIYLFLHTADPFARPLSCTHTTFETTFSRGRKNGEGGKKTKIDLHRVEITIKT